MPQLDPKQPLWMPQGSVRAILAIVVVIATVLLVAALALGRQLDAADAVAALVGLATLVLGFYFVTRGVSRGA